MSGRRFEQQRAQLFDHAVRSAIAEPVAHLFAAAQEPRSDDELSTHNFQVIAREERRRLRDCIRDYIGHGDGAEIGGVVETEATASVRRLIAAAEADGLHVTAALLRTAQERCRSIPKQRSGTHVSVVLPEPELVLDPTTGRPIGMWR